MSTHSAGAAPPTAAIILLAAVAFVLWWCFVVGLISYLSGWRRLAERFGDKPEGFLEETHRWQGMMLGWCGYNGCLTIEIHSGGVRFSLMPLLSVGHAPFFLPWRAIDGAKKERRFFREALCFAVKDAGAVLARIQLYSPSGVRIFEKLDMKSPEGGS